jgi:hypothetical protein
MNKRTSIVTWACGIAALITAICVIGAKPASKSGATVIPGIGVTMTLPEGVTIAPIGTNYMSDAKDIFMAVSVGPSYRNAETMTSARALYPDPAEPFQSSSLNGVLYKRTRAASGGTWDGWWLEVIRGDRVLDLKISYSGSRPEEFQDLKKYLLTASWNDKTLDPEIAFGLKLKIPDMQVVRAGAGALMYNQDGLPHPGAQYILLNTMPNSFHGDATKFHKLCALMAPAILHSESVSIRYQTEKQMTVCDAWTSTMSATSEYYAALMLPDGSIAQAHGHGYPDVFQHSLLDAQVILHSPFKPR